MICLLLMYASYNFAMPTAHAQLFSDDFTRGTDPGPLLYWTPFTGNWTVTGGAMRGGPNTNSGYGYVYTSTNSFTNFSVQAKIKFPVGAFGGGLGGRLDRVVGSHYAAWIYPENITGDSNVLKLIRFSDYTTFSVLNTSNLTSVGTNYHTVKLDFAGSQINVSLD